MSTSTHLTDAFETALSRFPSSDLIHSPTPLQPLKRLTAHLGGPNIWVKRDDATHISSGGNKMRKLDRVVTEAITQGCDTLVSGGVAQSNSQRQVATAAAMLGLECHLAVYQGRVQAPSDDYDVSGNVILNRLFGAHQHSVTWEGHRNQAIDALSEKLRAEGKKPFAIPYGVSNAMGALSYSSVVLEIAQQCDGFGFTPKTILAASGSGGTQSGLLVGAQHCLPDTEIIGVDVDADPQRVRQDVIEHGSGACALLGSTFNVDAVQVLSGFSGAAYGTLPKSTVEAMKLIGRLEAIILDPVYTGKAMAALIGLVQKGKWDKHDHIVFVHTGGMPATFAYAGAISST